MTAHGAYQLLVGEMGVARSVFLYDMRLWEVRAAVRGYRRRQESDWALVRWQTFILMHNGMVSPAKAGINAPADLLPLPHDGAGSQVDDAEVERLRGEIRRWNAEHVSAP